MRPVAVVMVDVDAEHLLKLSARALIEEIIEGVQALGDSLLEHAARACWTTSPAPTASSLRRCGPMCSTSYLRLRSIGFSHVGRESSFTLRP